MDNIVFREAETDDAEEMISYLNIVGENQIISCMDLMNFGI